MRTLLLPLLFVLSGALAAQTLLVLNKEDATLAFMNPVSGEVAATVPVGEGPHEIAVSDDGRLAFVGNYGARTPGGTLSIIDVPGRKEARRFDLGALRRPHGVSCVAGKVFFTAEANKVVARYDPASNQVDWIMGTGLAGTHMVVAASGGKTLYTANIGSDAIAILQEEQNGAWTQTVVPVGKGPEGFDISPDGRELWAAHSRDGGVSAIDLATKKVLATFDAGTKRSNRLKFTHDGKKVLISDLDGGSLVVVDVASRRVVNRIPMGKAPEGILLPPGSNEAFVAVAGDNNITVIDLNNFAVKRRIPTGKGPDGMAWIQ